MMSAKKRGVKKCSKFADKQYTVVHIFQTEKEGGDQQVPTFCGRQIWKPSKRKWKIILCSCRPKYSMGADRQPSLCFALTFHLPVPLKILFYHGTDVYVCQVYILYMIHVGIFPEALPCKALLHHFVEKQWTSERERNAERSVCV